MPYFQSLISLLTDDTPSSNTPSSSRNASNSLFAAFPSSLPNVHIPIHSPSRHSASQPIHHIFKLRVHSIL